MLKENERVEHRAAGRIKKKRKSGGENSTECECLTITVKVYVGVSLAHTRQHLRSVGTLFLWTDYAIKRNRFIKSSAC